MIVSHCWRKGQWWLTVVRKSVWQYSKEVGLGRETISPLPKDLTRIFTLQTFLNQLPLTFPPTEILNPKPYPALYGVHPCHVVWQGWHYSHSSVGGRYTSALVGIQVAGRSPRHGSISISLSRFARLYFEPRWRDSRLNGENHDLRDLGRGDEIRIGKVWDLTIHW